MLAVVLIIFTYSAAAARQTNLFGGQTSTTGRRALVAVPTDISPLNYGSRIESAQDLGFGSGYGYPTYGFPGYGFPGYGGYGGLAAEAAFTSVTAPAPAPAPEPAVAPSDASLPEQAPTLPAPLL